MVVEQTSEREKTGDENETRSTLRGEFDLELLRDCSEDAQHARRTTISGTASDNPERTMSRIPALSRAAPMTLSGWGPTSAFLPE